MKLYYSDQGIDVYHGKWQDFVVEEDGQFDLLLTDPPYGIGEAAGKNKSRTNLAVARDYGHSTWDDAPPKHIDILRMRSAAEYQIIFGGNYFHLPPAKCWLVWDKINSGDFADCELAWTNLDKAVRQFRYMWNGMLKEQPEVRHHPTQKPLALMKWCISQAPSTVKSILDPYAGSGTTLVAAKAMGLAATGVEISEAYCEVIAKRLSQGVFDFDPIDLPIQPIQEVLLG